MIHNQNSARSTATSIHMNMANSTGAPVVVLPQIRAVAQRVPLVLVMAQVREVVETHLRNAASHSSGVYSGI